MDGVSGLKPDVRCVQIVRVNNGWMLSDPGEEMRWGHSRPLLVARTPREIAGIVQVWAEQQEKASDLGQD